MPTRLFDQLDVINIVEGFTLPLSQTNIAIILTNTSFSHFSFAGVGTDVQAGTTTAQVVFLFRYTKTGTVDFTIFPALPTIAQITKVIIRGAANFSITTSESVTVAGSANNIQSNVRTSFLIPSANDQTGSPLSFTASDSIDGTVLESVYDPPISYEEFILTYSNVLLEIQAPSIFPPTPIFGGLAVATGGLGSVNNAGVSFSAAITDWSIEVFYDLPGFQFSLNTESPVSVGQEVEIGSDNSDDIDEVTIVYTTLDNVEHMITIPRSDFPVKEPTRITFIVPDIGDSPKIRIYVTGTTFGGSVFAGTLFTIFFLNGTGIYKLDPNSTHDTVYIQDFTPVQTTDIKIPNPFVKTGFVP
jgi:hypothetical protein